MQILFWIMNFYMEGSYKTFFVSAFILILAASWGVAVAYPDISENRRLATPIELSVENLKDFEPVYNQYYTISGSEIFDTGWESNIRWEQSNELIVRHYIGALVVGDRLIIVKALSPINPASTTFMGNMYRNSLDEYDAIRDLVQQAPELEEQFLSFYIVERDSTPKPEIFTLPVFVTCILVWFSLMGFIFFAVKGRKDSSQLNQTE